MTDTVLTMWRLCQGRVTLLLCMYIDCIVLYCEWCDLFNEGLKFQQVEIFVFVGCNTSRYSLQQAQIEYTMFFCCLFFHCNVISLYVQIALHCILLYLYFCICNVVKFSFFRCWGKEFHYNKHWYNAPWFGAVVYWYPCITLYCIHLIIDCVVECLSDAFLPCTFRYQWKKNL